jgi:acyl-CoA synthetase (AMP-forming)/AMP-acid ligase II
LQANTQSILAYLGLEHTDRIMVVLPFHYCFGTSLLHTHLRAGGSLALAPTFVYPEIVLNQIEETGCTGFAGVPSTYQTLLRNSTFPQRQIRSLRAIQQAGGKLENVLIHELRSSVPNGQVFVMYGQTEATARLSYLPPELLDSKMGSIGRGIPGVTLKVLQDDGQEAAPGQVGEIWAWGKNISPGYLDNPEATAQKFVSGALRTGDLATVDEEGYLFVVDRKADFIKSYGYRVSSQQIEACILELPEVVAAAVIGEADLARGEAILAFVVLREGAVLQADEVIAHCARHLARHMLPRDVWFIPRLPMNANGKVIKTELRKLAETTPEHQDPA